MATDFKYASQSDLKNYFNQFADYDEKVQIFPTLTSGNLHLFRDSGYVDTLFVNGEELAAAQSTSGAVDSNGEWFYNSSTNQVEYYNSNYSSTTIHEQVFEGGVDFATFIDQQLVNASLELNNYLDGRYQTPLPKSSQIDTNTATASLTPEYDPIIIKATCYICASNLVRAKNPTDELADYYMNLVTNTDGTGIVDRLNKGEFKLSFEVDAKDSKGKIKEITRSGSMYLVETAGGWIGEAYDILRITCTTTGAYGTAKVKYEYYGNNKLLGTESTDHIVTGGLMEVNGLFVRFQGASMTQNDQWEIEVTGVQREVTNSKGRSVELNRRGFGY
mgnify:CR=1 FL=1|tara:strand:- start:1701 stop:2696 length:996 start_codon:yes stop_codon:yes gene_type:complete